ncbi:MAG: hypothetical protein ACOYXT_00055 [Bacteroidota bacterium]
MKTVIIILRIGLLIGVMDGLAASLNAYLSSGVMPDRVFRFIASGVFGVEAFKGSGAMIVWGVMFHLLIALLWTAFYLFLNAKFDWIRQHHLVSGVLYGVFIWAVMAYVVLPLSNTPTLAKSLSGALIMIGIHIFVIGIPMSHMLGRYSSYNIAKR